jgi:ketosteroid isomerase-like protein
MRFLRLPAMAAESHLISGCHCPTRKDMNDDSAIIAANAAFYAAFAAGDFAAMSRLWADDDDITCIHPGWPAIIGRTGVIGGWRDILQNPGRPNITCAEPYAVIDGDSGRVLCIEIVDGAALAATNCFRRIDGAWRLVHHQSSPIAQIITQGDDDPSDPARRLH